MPSVIFGKVLYILQKSKFPRGMASLAGYSARAGFLNLLSGHASLPAILYTKIGIITG